MGSREHRIRLGGVLGSTDNLRIMVMGDFYEAALAGIRELKKATPDMASLCDYYAAILQAQRETKSSFHPDIDSLDIERCRQRMAEGLPFLRPEDIRLDWELFHRLFDRIGEISREWDRSNGPAAWPPISDIHFDTHDEWHETLLRGLLENKALLDESAGRIGADLRVFALLACQSITPFLESYAEHVRAYIDDSVWHRGYCPVCSGEPLMGKLAPETGKRFLECHLCRTEWSFKRLECPFCGNSDQEKLRFFYDQEDSVHRVEVCDLCKAYLKTVDARRTQKALTLFVEDLATLHLDLVAEREGFGRKRNRPFSK